MKGRKDRVFGPNRGHSSCNRNNHRISATWPNSQSDLRKISAQHNSKNAAKSLETIERRVLQVESHMLFKSEFLKNFKTTRMESHNHFDIFLTEKVLNDVKWKGAVERFPLKKREHAAVLLELFAKHESFMFISAWIEEPPSRWQERADQVLFKIVSEEQRQRCWYHDRFGRSDRYKEDRIFLYVEWKEFFTLTDKVFQFRNMLRDRLLQKLKQNGENKAREDRLQWRKLNRSNARNMIEPERISKQSTANELNGASNDQRAMNDLQPSESVQDFKSKFLMNFKPTKILGEGGFGIVFEVEVKLIGAAKIKRAIKRIPIKSTREVNKAMREVKELNRLKPGRIVHHFDSWIENTPEGWQNEVDDKIFEELNYTPKNYCPDECIFLYIHTELCQFSLEDILSVMQYRIPAMMIDWFAQIVSAVTYIHKFSVIHRDLKPSNILFDNDNKLKVCDFGIVTDRKYDWPREKLVERTGNSGTQMYMAPEQSGSLYTKYTAKVDIFALGLVLTRMCVVMTRNEAEECFNDYRRGRASPVLDHLPKIKDLVSLLTKVDQADRPTADELCKYPLLEEHCDRYLERTVKMLQSQNY